MALDWDEKRETGYTNKTDFHLESDINPRTFKSHFLKAAFAAIAFCRLAMGHAHAEAVPALDPNFYAYDSSARFAVTEAPYARFRTITVTCVSFPSPVVTTTPVNNTVTGFLFLPPGPGPRPVVLVEHEWLPITLDNEFRMCRRIAEGGMAAFLIVQPYSYNRRPQPRLPEVELLSADVPQMVGAVRQAVLDARRAFDWLQMRPDVDAGRMGVAGISLGGIFAPLIAGVDHRAKVVVTIVGGADVSDIVFDSPITYGIQPGFHYHGVTYETLKRDMAPVEPANWLRGFDARNALLFNGRYDVFISPKQAKHLSKALGGAPIVWTNTGHYGTVFAEKEIETTGIRFLRSRFGLDTAPFTPPSTLPAPTIKVGLLAGGREGVSPAIAYQVINFDEAGRFSVDGQLTLHGLALAPSTNLDESNSIGLELPLLHGRIRPKLFYFLHFTL